MNQQDSYVIELERILDLLLTHLGRINEHDFSHNQEQKIGEILESFSDSTDKLDI